jgi:acylpyruvate hydrolase
MKIVGFTTDAGPRLGVVEGDLVVDLQAVDPDLPADLAGVLARHNGDLKPLAALAGRAPAAARRPLAGLKFALPVARPGKIVCLGLNYLDHVKEGPNANNVPKFPTLFMRGMNSFVPHQHALARPRVSETFDYEAEMVAVIGARAKHMTLANALSCVAGYTCSNEGSANFSATPPSGTWARTSTTPAASGHGS